MIKPIGVCKVTKKERDIIKLCDRISKTIGELKQATNQGEGCRRRQNDMNATVKMLMLNATKEVGANVEDIVLRIEEQLTFPQIEEVRAFLTWSFGNEKFFGWGNIDARIKEFKASKRKKRV